jgi:hypothetical protein
VLELAVAVQLVAEEVREQQRARLHAARDLGQCALVDLQQAELRVARGEEGGGDPRDEVGTGAVPGEPAPAQDLRHHRRRRRLAVRGGDEGGAVGQPRGQRVDRAWIELPEQLARDRRAPARAGEAREPRRSAGGEGLDG